MKPTLDIRNRCDSIKPAVPTSRVFPKTDLNYKAITLADLDGPGAGCCKSSFRAISQDCFANEAPRHFAHEAALFFHDGDDDRFTVVRYVGRRPGAGSAFDDLPAVAAR
jgi:hypothetical protein